MPDMEDPELTIKDRKLNDVSNRNSSNTIRVQTIAYSYSAFHFQPRRIFNIAESKLK